MGQDDRGAAQHALPVLARLPFGVGLVMQRAEPLRKDERDRLMDAHGFPDWDYVPPDEGEPFEYKASDWGRLSDGRLVALDYSAPALGSPNKGESFKKGNDDRADRTTEVFS